MSKGFDLDSYDFTEYASALDGENPSSTDCDMESESIWTPHIFLFLACLSHAVFPRCCVGVGGLSPGSVSVV
jgi:hypothetical protein